MIMLLRREGTDWIKNDVLIFSTAIVITHHCKWKSLYKIFPQTTTAGGSFLLFGVLN